MITILGGGVAGVAAAYAATQRGLRFRLHEGSDELGGNAVTLRRGEFLFDSGAHRLHDRNPIVLAQLRTLLPDELLRVTAPSRIYYSGRYVRFPLALGSLLRNLPPYVLARMIVDFADARLRRGLPGASFKDLAVRTYGYTVAEAFLLSYSEKLWGRPCEELSPEIAGRRLQPLSLRSFLREVIGMGTKPAHLEGDFYYPRRGIGRIVEGLAAACPSEALHRRHRVTRIVHSGGRIRAVRINEDSWEDTDELVSTLPLTLTIALLDPAPPEQIVRLAQTLHFRSLVLVVHCLNVASISPFASTYFPEAIFPFTRVHEPRCRSAEMAPPGKTSLVAEIPCQTTDDTWRSDDHHLVQRVGSALESLGWIGPKDVCDAAVHRMPHAYPVLTLDAVAALRAIVGWLQRFENLTLIGRSSGFAYLHIHDLVAEALSKIALLDSNKRTAS